MAAKAASLPEESLDPKSVFDELVGLLITAKSKRRLIMVTHNANLVINDACQSSSRGREFPASQDRTSQNQIVY